MYSGVCVKDAAGRATKSNNQSPKQKRTNKIEYKVENACVEVTLHRIPEHIHPLNHES